MYTMNNIFLKIRCIIKLRYSNPCVVLIKAFEEARPVVRWLNKQRRERGGYGSTQVVQTFYSLFIDTHLNTHTNTLFFLPVQATLMVYQAVADYWTGPKGQDFDLDVDILLPGRSKPDRYNCNSENLYATRTSKVRTHTTHIHTHTHTQCFINIMMMMMMI